MHSSNPFAADLAPRDATATDAKLRRNSSAPVLTRDQLHAVAEDCRGADDGGAPGAADASGSEDGTASVHHDEQKGWVASWRSLPAAEAQAADLSRSSSLGSTGAADTAPEALSATNGTHATGNSTGGPALAEAVPKKKVPPPRPPKPTARPPQTAQPSHG